MAAATIGCPNLEITIPEGTADAKQSSASMKIDSSIVVPSAPSAAPNSANRASMRAHHLKRSRVVSLREPSDRRCDVCRAMGFAAAAEAEAEADADEDEEADVPTDWW